MVKAPTVNQHSDADVSSATEVADFFTQGCPDGSFEFDASSVSTGFTIKVFGHNNNPDDRDSGEGKELGSVSVSSNGHDQFSWSGEAWEYITIEITSYTDGTLSEWWLWLSGLSAPTASGGTRNDS